MGEGQYAPTAVQAQLPVEALWQSKELALWAFCKVPDSGLAATSFVDVKQAADEPFIKFLDKLKVALDNQIDNVTVQEILLKQLAVENTNPDCQRILRPLRAPTVIEMLKACQGISTASQNMTLLSEPLTTMSVLSRLSISFSCGKPAHVRRECPRKKRGSGERSMLHTLLEKTALCEQCVESKSSPTALVNSNAL